MIIKHAKLLILLDEQLHDYKLTVREERIIKLWIRDFDYEEIAAALSITDSTVRKHIDSVYARLGVYSRSDLILHIIGSIVAKNTRCSI